MNMKTSTETLLLKIAVSAAAVVPVAAGLAGVIGGALANTASFDSHYRYLSGLLLGLGVAFWSVVPDLGRRSPLLGVLTLIVFTGGVCRLYALAVRGDPGVMGLALIMEMIVTPALFVWHRRVASRCSAATTEADLLAQQT